MLILNLSMILHIFGLHLISVLAIDYPEVILNQGTVSGFYDKTASGRSFSSFFGIPYAKPPVGKYRFKEAKPAEPWMGTFNATILPSSCLQYDYIHYLTNFAVHGEEDCLFVNVFSPKLPTPGSNDRLLDVIVFIHGGAFMSLDGHSFAPHLIMEKDVVFVTFNYRVGPLGFLSTEDDVIPGNYGLKDQVLALKWIKDNVQAFGGDPQRISLTGLSAGGTSVHYHMLSNKSKGIFRNAMALSGTALNPWSQADGARSKAFRIGRELGCPLTDSRQLLKCLRYRPARQIVSLSKIFMPWLYLPFSPFGPVVEKPSESAFIDRPPIEIMKAGVPNDVPLVLSYTSHEGVFPNAEIVCNETNFKILNENWLKIAPHLLDYNYTVEPSRLDEVSKAIWSRYMADKEKASVTDLVQVVGDRLFVGGIVQTALLQAKSMKSPVYVYQFSYRGENSFSNTFCDPKLNFGVSHGDDLSYVLPVFLVSAGNSDDDKQMKKNMVELWTQFAASGKPKFVQSSEQWPSVKENLPKLSYFNILSPYSGSVEFSEDKSNLDFWKTLGIKENVLRKVKTDHSEL